MSRLSDTVDAALDWSVLGGYTRVGSSLRRRLDHWTPLEGGRLEGRVVVLTGATSGLGHEAALALVRMGAELEIVARDAGKARALCAELRATTDRARVGFVVADTGDLVAIRSAATELLRRHAQIHVLIHNAGALDDTHHLSSQGIEQTVASQVIGPFLLTERLLPGLRAGAPARVLWVSSGGMYAEPLSVDALEMPGAAYDGTVAYARAKRAQVTLAAMWAERLADDGIFVASMHPGWVDTPGVARSLPRFRRVLGRLLRDTGDGADTLVWLAADDAVVHHPSGGFWHDRRPRPLHRLDRTRRSDTAEARERLWRWVQAQAAR